jgi:hypothetical protein
MMNVDGVELGNARTDALGFDTNRVWTKTRKDLQPVVHSFKEMVKHIEGGIAMVLDLHGHSTKYLYSLKRGSTPSPMGANATPSNAAYFRSYWTN